MKYNNQFGIPVSSDREGLGLTQPALAHLLEVEASHIAVIDGGRRKPTFKLIACLADTFGLDRKTFLFLLIRKQKSLSPR